MTNELRFAGCGPAGNVRAVAVLIALLHQQTTRVFVHPKDLR
jgi:hypothetical protein